jgi:hypothetical protein
LICVVACLLYQSREALKISIPLQVFFAAGAYLIHQSLFSVILNPISHGQVKYDLELLKKDCSKSSEVKIFWEF